MFVKPAPGMAVRDPDLRDVLPADGREVARNDYWLRRFLDGDVTCAELEKEAEAAKEEAEPEKSAPAIAAPKPLAADKKEAR